MKNINKHFDKNTVLHAIKLLTRKDADFTIANGLMLFTPIFKGEKPIFYGFKRRDDFTIGKGSYGRIYKAYALNPTTAEPILDKFIIVKEVKTEDFEEKEFNIGSSFIDIYETFTHGDFTYIPQPYLGSSLKNNPEVIKLSPKNLLSLIKNLVFKMNEMHHPALRSSMVIAHGDVKMDNILVRILYNSLSQPSDITVNFIDFGLSKTLETIQVDKDQKTFTIADDNPSKLHEFTVEGNEYFPEETKTQNPQFGIKSDIFQLAAVIAELLGAQDKSHLNQWVFTQSKYTLAELPKLAEFKFGAEVDKIIVDFINTMRHKDYNSRPDSDITCQFFFTLGNLQKAQTLHDGQRVLDIMAKLISLTEGSWSQEQEYKTSYRNSVSTEVATASSGSSSQTDTSTSSYASKNSFSTFARPSVQTPTGTAPVSKLGEIVCLL